MPGTAKPTRPAPTPSKSVQRFCSLPDAPHVEVRTAENSAVPYAPHFHLAYSVGVVFAGSTLLTYESGSMVLRKGDMVAIGLEQVHSCNPVNHGQRSYHMFTLEPHWVHERLGLTGSGHLHIPVRRFRDPVVFHSLMKLAELLAAGDQWPEGEANLVRCLAQCGQVRQASESAPVAPLDLHPQAAALQRGMRRETWTRRFRRAHGLPPAAYRQCLRLAQARALLRQGHPIAQTAQACGFSDQSHLHRMCVKYYAATPRQLRSHSYKKR